MLQKQKMDTQQYLVANAVNGQLLNLGYNHIILQSHFEYMASSACQDVDAWVCYQNHI